MKYDDFEGKPLPLLMERIKINLREQRIDFYTYGDQFKPQPLYIKSRHIEGDFPNYQAQIAFDEKLSSFEWLDLNRFGPAIDEFEEHLSQVNIFIDGFTINSS